jgi:hypothetical protein
VLGTDVGTLDVAQLRPRAPSVADTLAASIRGAPQ